MWNHARPMVYARLRLHSVIKTKTSDSTQLHAFEGIKTLDNKILRPKPELRVIKVGICSVRRFLSGWYAWTCLTLGHRLQGLAELTTAGSCPQHLHTQDLLVVSGEQGTCIGYIISVQHIPSSPTHPQQADQTQIFSRRLLARSFRSTS